MYKHNNPINNNDHYGVKEHSSPGPHHTGPKVHAEEEETPEDELRES